MNVRQATICDVERIHALISGYAEKDRMLPRSLADIYENLQTFLIAEDENGNPAGCCALQIIWSDLAEIKSLAVFAESVKKGFGRALVQSALKLAQDLGIARVFTLTLEQEFFEKLGFTKIQKEQLPMKVWSDCAKCPKQQNCDEIAMVISKEQL
jgi:amino-acid N-acetyltransferase